MTSPINWKMISHPINWIEIILMLVIAGAIGHMLLSLLQVEPSTSQDSSFANVNSGLAPASVAGPIIDPASVS